jgi:hypothetical protein
MKPNKEKTEVTLPGFGLFVQSIQAPDKSDWRSDPTKES